jgi:hypothetical protein
VKTVKTETTQPQKTKENTQIGSNLKSFVLLAESILCINRQDKIKDT